MSRSRRLDAGARRRRRQGPVAAGSDPGAPTLFAPPLEGRTRDERVRLGRAAAAHARARRLEAGARVVLVDGRGGRWTAEAVEVDADCVECRLLDRAPAPPPLPVELAFGLGNKTHTLWMVEKAVELGATGLQPLECERSRSVADAARSAGFWRKAGRRAVAALTQCGGAHLPEIAAPVELGAYVERARVPGPVDEGAGSRDRTPVQGGAPEADRPAPAVVLDRSGAPLIDVLGAWTGGDVLRILAGPEGGLTAAEREACAAAGFVAAALGARTLRFETAAVAALAVAAQRVRDGWEIGSGTDVSRGGEDGPDPELGRDAGGEG